MQAKSRESTTSATRRRTIVPHTLIMVVPRQGRCRRRLATSLARAVMVPRLVSVGSMARRFVVLTLCVLPLLAVVGAVGRILVVMRKDRDEEEKGGGIKAWLRQAQSPNHSRTSHTWIVFVVVFMSLCC